MSAFILKMKVGVNGNITKSGKPTASQVVNWAKWMAKNHKGVDIDGRYGFQC